MSTFSNPLTEYSPQMEFAAGPLTESEDESEHGLFDESQELELAANLLEVHNEEQLHHFLDHVIREAGTAAGGRVAPSDAHAIGSVLENAVHQILPAAHAANADHSATRNSVGAQLGVGLSSMAGPVLGLELEGLSPEDREVEAVRQFVRFAGQTVKNAIEHASGADPHDVAHRAATEAAEVYAPGLFADGQHVPGNRGRWISCHDRIILFGV